MSLNDPHWGRNGSTDEPQKEEPGKVKEEEQDSDYVEPPLRNPEINKDKKPVQENRAPEEADLEELWRQFNDRLSSMMGGNKRGSTRGQYESQESKQPQDSDFKEPPLRKNQDFQEPGIQGKGNRGGFIPPGVKLPSAVPGAAFGAACLIALGAWLASGFYIVPEGQKGVVTTFGKYTESTSPGFRWHFPQPIQDAELVDVNSVRKAEIGMRGTSMRLKEALMLTDDENIVDVMFNVQYRIKDGHGAEEFLFKTRDPMGAVVQSAESAMREVVGRKKMDSVLFESKQEIAEEVKKLMQEMLDRYHSGIQILSVAIQNAQPPEQVQAAFNDAVKAGQDRERQINEGEAYANDVVPKAKGTAERLRQEAEAYKSRIVSQAEGDASRFDQVYKQYEQAPKVTRDRMYVDTMQQIFNNTNKIMVDSKGSNNLLYLPLDKLLENSKRDSSSSTPISSSTGGSSEQTKTPQPQTNGEVDEYTSRPLSRNLR